MFATSHNMQAGSSDHQIPAARATTFTYKALRAALPPDPGLQSLAESSGEACRYRSGNTCSFPEILQETMVFLTCPTHT